MSLSELSIESIALEHLASLVANAVPEGRTIEFKESFPGNSDSDKREFLADVTSFANTSGGELVYGIACSAGIPTAIKGIATSDLDAQILRLENLLCDGVEPRIVGSRFHPITATESTSAVVLRIPHSLQAPHMITLGNWSRFFARNSRGKYQLDVGELRHAFGESASAIERVRQFRAFRAASIKADDTPILLDDTPRVILHLVPLAQPMLAPDLQALAKERISPLFSEQSNTRFNLDGLTYYATGRDNETTHSYLQVFRDGALEAVASSLVRGDDVHGKFIVSFTVEGALIDGVERYLQLLQHIGARPPVVILISFLNIKGYRIQPLTEGRSFSSFRRPIRQHDVLLPDVVVPEFGMPIDALLRPIFDVLWNAAGWDRCHNYDEQGNRLRGLNHRSDRA